LWLFLGSCPVDVTQDQDTALKKQNPQRKPHV
jgi:hypothetical protein